MLVFFSLSVQAVEEAARAAAKRATGKGAVASDAAIDDNDVLFDGDEDEINEAWLLEVYSRERVASGATGGNGGAKKKSTSTPKKKRGLKSDATLSCPGCFTLVCLESQLEFPTQYR